MEDWFSFWNQYPRKIGFKVTKKLWETLSVAQRQKALEQIPLHVRMWNVECRLIQHIPMPYNWIAGERWEDEIQMPEAPQAQWWTSDEATMAYGRSKGIPAAPGMTMQQYREHLRRAA